MDNAGEVLSLGTLFLSCFRFILPEISELKLNPWYYCCYGSTIKLLPRLLLPPLYYLIELLLLLLLLLPSADYFLFLYAI